MMYTKDEFIKKMAKKGYTQKDCHQVLTDFIGTLEDILKEGNGVTFRGFGNFDVKTRSARSGTNPATGEKIDIPETKVIRFSAGNLLKRTVREALEG